MNMLAVFVLGFLDASFSLYYSSFLWVSVAIFTVLLFLAPWYAILGGLAFVYGSTGLHLFSPLTMFSAYVVIGFAWVFIKRSLKKQKEIELIKRKGQCEKGAKRTEGRLLTQKQRARIDRRLNQRHGKVRQREEPQKIQKTLSMQTDSGDSGLNAVAGMSPLKKQSREEVVDDLAAHGQLAKNKEPFKEEEFKVDYLTILQPAFKDFNESVANCNVIVQRILLLAQSDCLSRQDLDDWLRVSGASAQKMNAAGEALTQMKASHPTLRYDDLEQNLATWKQASERMTSNIVKRLSSQLSSQSDLADVVSAIENLQYTMAEAKPDLSGSYSVLNMTRGSLDYFTIEKK
jgi:hypothetical protein